MKAKIYSLLRGKAVIGRTTAGHARTRNTFVAVNERGKKELDRLFEKEVTEEEVARELAYLIDEGSITIKRE